MGGDVERCGGEPLRRPAHELKVRPGTFQRNIGYADQVDAVEPENLRQEHRPEFARADHADTKGVADLGARLEF